MSRRGRLWHVLGCGATCYKIEIIDQGASELDFKRGEAEGAEEFIKEEGRYNEPQAMPHSPACRPSHLAKSPDSIIYQQRSVWAIWSPRLRLHCSQLGSHSEMAPELGPYVKVLDVPT